jgi:hypothetical protein
MFYSKFKINATNMQSFRVIIISSCDYFLFIFRKLVQIWITIAILFAMAIASFLQMERERLKIKTIH